MTTGQRLSGLQASVVSTRPNGYKKTLFRSPGRSCVGPSLTSRGAVTSALQRVDFYSHLAITYQRTEDEPFLMPVHLPGILFQNICEHLI